MRTWHERDRAMIWHPYDTSYPNSKRTYPVVMRAQGSRLYTTDHRTVIDAISSWWVTLHGHSKPEIVEAIAKQAGELDHSIFARFTHKPAIELSELLLEKASQPFAKVFFSDNGSTAVEVALKMSLQFQRLSGRNCKTFVYLEGAYHGDTFGAMSVAQRGVFTTPFQSLLFDAIAIPKPTKNNIQDILATLPGLFTKKEVAGFIFEPLVQGAAGFKVYDPELLKLILTLCKKHSVITIADEVLTGFGRTGPCFAVELVENEVDILCAAKGLTGGTLPLAVTLCKDAISQAFAKDSPNCLFFHGHSYTANPIACAAAVANLKLLNNESKEHRDRIHGYYQKRMPSLQVLKSLENVRTLGTIFAADICSLSSEYINLRSAEICDFFFERGVLTRPLGNTIYFIPPFETDDEELGRIFDTLEEFSNGLQ